MSVARLHLEQELRAQEERVRVEEERLAHELRQELAQPVPQRVGTLVPLLGSGERVLAAERLLRWWRNRPNRQARVTNAQIESLARQIRRGGKP